MLSTYLVLLIAINSVCLSRTADVDLPGRFYNGIKNV